MYNIWWNQVPAASGFIDSLVSLISEERSVILLTPGYLPWKECMYERMIAKINYLDPESNVDFFSGDDIARYGDVSKFMLDMFCKREKRLSYRRGQSVASFLAKSKDIVLNNRYVWIHNVSREQMAECVNFISEYQSAVNMNEKHGVFILEAQEDLFSARVPKGIKQFSFNHCVSPFDSFAFCTLASTGISLKNPVFKPYMAEIVSAVCGNDIELCAACISRKEDFLKDPYNTLKRIAEEETRSDGLPYSYADEKTVSDAVWEGQVRSIFPYLEKYRRKFVFNHYDEIKKSIPFKKGDGDEYVTDPCDVELGQLMYLLAKDRYIQPSKSESESLPIFKEARNKLAHLSPIAFDEVESILTCYF